MQTLVYTIGAYCLLKAVFLEAAVLIKPTVSVESKLAVLGATAFLFLAAIEAFNQ